MKKRLIEYDLPLADISNESASEKNARHGHPATLHIWWARRPLASSRATIFASLIDDPGSEKLEKRDYYNEFVSKLSSWSSVKDGDSNIIHQAICLIKEQFGRNPIILDPFGGGGQFH
ncbi:MAG: DUF1156 domain-containing protein [Candidatus Hodarchaeales archaeon]|jgi:adenine-specific DNA methylase